MQSFGFNLFLQMNVTIQNLKLFKMRFIITQIKYQI